MSFREQDTPPVADHSPTTDILSREKDAAATAEVELENTDKSRWERSWPVIACGAGLFSDGYLNNASSSSICGTN